MSGDKASKDIIGNAVKKLDGQMCYVIDWRDEELPLENKEGDAMDRLVQRCIDETQRTPPLLEHFQKKGKEEPPKLPLAPEPKKESVLVFADREGFCHGILNHAPEGRLGQKKIVPDAAETLVTQQDVKQLLGKGWDLVIFGCSLDLPPSNAVQDIIHHQNRVAKLYYHIIQLAAKEEIKVKKMAVLTRGCFSEDEDLNSTVGLGLVTSGFLYGMSNTARLEIEDCAIQLIETEFCLTAPYWKQQHNQLLPRLASEVFRFATFGHNTVRIMHDGRYVLRHRVSTEYEAASQYFAVPPQGIIAITGGNGALGLIMGEWLLDKAAEQKVGGFEVRFLSRSTKVSDQNMPAWKSIQKKAAALQVKVEQTRCDISTPDACEALIADCSPNLRGIIHSAGILQDSMLLNMTWEKYDAVWDSKHRAALHLHDALGKHDNPEFAFFWMFSSIAVYGNMGQTNYSASNSYLDALCRHRRATGKPATAMQWGSWGEVGMAANMDEHNRKRHESGPMPPFSTKDGLSGMEAGLRTGLPGFSVYKIAGKPMCDGLVACDTTTQCYMRNFYSEYAPSPGAPSLDRFHLYTMYRLLREGYYGGPSKRVIYDKFVKPAVDEELDSSWW